MHIMFRHLILYEVPSAGNSSNSSSSSNNVCSVLVGLVTFELLDVSFPDDISAHSTVAKNCLVPVLSLRMGSGNET